VSEQGGCVAPLGIAFAINDFGDMCLVIREITIL
jgi:hypothetical protein